MRTYIALLFTIGFGAVLASDFTVGYPVWYSAPVSFSLGALASCAWRERRRR